MKVVVTIPAYNEEKTIGNVINRIKKVMDKNSYNYEVIVVDDGSTDKTTEIARKAGAKVFSHPRNYGLIEAFRTEMEKCLELGADIIVHTDADGQYNMKDIPKLIKKVEEGYDLVLASRFKGGIEKMPFTKKIGNIAFTKVISHISKQKISDAQTGFRAFTKEVAEKVKMISNYTYTQEQIIRASKMKFAITEIPSYFAKRDGSESRLMSGPVHYALRAGLNLVRVYRDYEPIKFFGMIGAVFFLSGVSLGAYLVYLFLRYGMIGKTPSLILSMLLILTGIQIIIFGLLADMHRK